MLCGIKIVEQPYTICVYPTSPTSILRETSIDGTGWSPARRLKVRGRLYSGTSDKGGTTSLQKTLVSTPC